MPVPREKDVVCEVKYERSSNILIKTDGKLGMYVHRDVRTPIEGYLLKRLSETRFMILLLTGLVYDNEVNAVMVSYKIKQLYIQFPQASVFGLSLNGFTTTR
jgi:hypothetical protein